jgi:hypothetical protein
MSSDDKEGNYCSICGGISPGKVTVKQISINGKLIGIDSLDSIVAEVRALNLSDDVAIAEELLKRVKKTNYVPTIRSKDYSEALLKEYKSGG